MAAATMSALRVVAPVARVAAARKTVVRAAAKVRARVDPAVRRASSHVSWG
jgi:hypothetical protein|tara:strand:+ start:1023 stop:1175 length:153 start_codon:yes stop_codon:yes gene_type:complete